MMDDFESWFLEFARVASEYDCGWMADPDIKESYRENYEDGDSPRDCFWEQVAAC